MTKQIEVALDDLVDRIKTEHEVRRQANAHRLGARLKAGELFSEAKAGLAHGQILP